MQTRQWLAYTLEAEVKADMLTEANACTIARHLMTDNQYSLFTRLHTKE